MKSSACVATFALVAHFAVAAALGATILLDAPSGCPSRLAVAHVDDIRGDRPELFHVFAPHRDVWQRLDDKYAGSVFVCRDGVANHFKILSALHGQWSVHVEYNVKTDTFQSVCFYDEFDRSGKAIGAAKSDDLAVIPWKVVDGVLQVSTNALRPRH